MQDKILKNGKLFVISGPSGAGKSTLIEEVLKSLGNFKASVSVTTRPKRKNEIEGKKYIFISDSEFDDYIKKGQFLEHAVYCGYKYGTPKDFVKRELGRGNNVLLEIEVQGAMQVKNSMPEAYMIFIMPGTIEELKKRLSKRNTESLIEIERRLQAAKKELDFQQYYDCIIINNDYNEALLNLKYILNENTK
ncbi:MAG: guanylate kinase [Actinobacteria bacterium]|nr:guanylate kinase [Actinomycetota bacterium]